MRGFELAARPSRRGGARAERAGEGRVGDRRYDRRAAAGRLARGQRGRARVSTPYAASLIGNEVMPVNAGGLADERDRARVATRCETNRAISILGLRRARRRRGPLSHRVAESVSRRVAESETNRGILGLRRGQQLRAEGEQGFRCGVKFTAADLRL